MLSEFPSVEKAADTGGFLLFPYHSLIPVLWRCLLISLRSFGPKFCLPGLALACAALFIPQPGRAQAKPGASLPLEYGVLVQGGPGVTEERDAFKFIMAGVHAGKVLTHDHGPGFVRGNFEYAMEAFPFWQSYTPKFQRANCTSISGVLYCSQLFTVGGTYTGVTITPIILRWNMASEHKLRPWVQAAGGVLWTNHKYPAFGGLPLNITNDGPNADASVWNFTPQGGIGAHYFVRPQRSVDIGINAIHISSASLGDRNPGVNVTLQMSLGYSWWK